MRVVWCMVLLLAGCGSDPFSHESASGSPDSESAGLQRFRSLAQGGEGAAWLRSDGTISLANSGPRAGLEVTLPRRWGEAPVTLSDPSSSLSVAFTVADWKSVGEAKVDRGWVAYRGARPGTTLGLRSAPLGVEDYWLLDSDHPPRIEYQVDVSRVAGLREVDGVVEFLDDEGAPRIRVGPAVVVDAAGVTRRARLGIDGCAVDRSPAAPWQRAITRPGARECTLSLVWDDRGLVPPVVVDPPWTMTSGMIVERWEHTATVLGDGRVLVVGQQPDPFNPTKASELYDPATGTFAATGVTNVERRQHTATLLADGRVLIVGGDQGEPTPECEIYDPKTGAFTPTGSLKTRRYDHSALRLADGRVLVVAGYGGFQLWELASTEIFNPAAGTWSPGPSLAQARTSASGTELADGRFLVAGGKTTAALASVEIFDPTTSTWKSAAPLGRSRWGHAATRLSDGRVLVSGGDDVLTSIGEVYDPSQGTWSTVQAGTERIWHRLIPLSDGSAMAIGGYQGTTELAPTDYFSPTKDTWLAAANLVEGRAHATATLLSDAAGTARILVAGGVQSKTAEVFQAKLRGLPCTGATACASNVCRDGYCCDDACPAPCRACAASLKGGGADGVCEPVPNGTDPLEECLQEAESTCGKTGVCDGAAACALHPAGTTCANTECNLPSELVIHRCDGQGKCEANDSNCGYYACDPTIDECPTSCESDFDCILSRVCLNQKCVDAPVGSGGTGGEPAGGAAGQTGTPSSGSSDGGCGCRSTPAQARAPWLLGFSLLAALRRRRRA